ncbi:NAD-dependent epimerase/dehydratase family protein [Parendozoicomonas sp. Alg238-R29]|uniref:NAD-dependent epimerase/dehydratase family protein n=1 Tax=Parendozoicomonas sp. Alg238-R29 TaxID=2993446 RepID=UPI00248DA8A3|nr:NAD-dependent epimerase/dehydratase family protein [Parendozoicomonas sp. Alg238-R29]
MTEKTALIVGSSGAVGRHILRLLLESDNYQKVISLVRRPSGVTHGKLVERIVDFDSLTSFTLNERVNHVYCSLGTTRKRAGSAEGFRKVDLDYVLALGEWSKCCGAERFGVISSIGAGQKGRGLYLQTKTEMEQGLKELDFSSLLIFRPSLLHGERDEFRLGEQLGYWGLKGMSWLPGLQQYQPVATETVARVMVEYVSRSHVEGLEVVEGLAFHETT